MRSLKQLNEVLAQLQSRASTSASHLEGEIEKRTPIMTHEQRMAVYTTLSDVYNDKITSLGRIAQSIRKLTDNKSNDT